jgi:hypothetical protein
VFFFTVRHPTSSGGIAHESLLSTPTSNLPPTTTTTIEHDGRLRWQITVGSLSVSAQRHQGSFSLQKWVMRTAMDQYVKLSWCLYEPCLFRHGNRVVHSRAQRTPAAGRIAKLSESSFPKFIFRSLLF